MRSRTIKKVSLELALGGVTAVDVILVLVPYLDQGSPTQPGFDQRLGHPASSVGSGPVHFGVVLP